MCPITTAGWAHIQQATFILSINADMLLHLSATPEKHLCRCKEGGVLLLLLLLLLLCSASVCLSHQLVLCAAAAAASFLGSGVEGLTDSSLQQLTNLKYLTHLKVEAEQTPAVSLSALSTISRLTSLRQLHWCSKDSLAGPLDTDCLTVQLCALTGNAWHVSVPGLICCQHITVVLLAPEPSHSRASFKWLSWGANVHQVCINIM